MHPIPHMEKTLRQGLGKKRQYEISAVQGFISLILVMYIIAPLLHEFLHLIVLKITGCLYTIDLGFKWYAGIYGRVELFSSIGFIGTIILLGIGILGNLFLGSALFIHGRRMRLSGMHAESNVIAFTGLGFFLNPTSYFFSRSGDLMNILNLMHALDMSFLLPVVGFFMFLLALIYLYEHSSHIIEEYRRIRLIEKEIEYFLYDINSK